MNLKSNNMHSGRLPNRRRRATAGLIVTGLALSVMSSSLGWAGASAATASTEAAVDTSARKRRVDLTKPTFSDPTNITNPLFPMSVVGQVIQLGGDKDGSLKHEVTLLPRTKVIEWNGQKVETLVSQFVAYQNGRVLEVAVDFYAQADDGSVWYFGENVDNYENGVIANHDGTWLAGRDGPPGMIMPADPKAGDVYRPENIPGVVFEEVTVQAVNLTVEGPQGAIEGAIRVREHLMDGTNESKWFAPGYGEFRAVHLIDSEKVTVALAVPIDALSGPQPAELRTLASGTSRFLNSRLGSDWTSALKSLRAVTGTWDAYRGTGEVPPYLEAGITGGLEELEKAIRAEKSGQTRQSAINLSHALLDLQLRYRPFPKVDLDRLELWARQLTLDASANDKAGMAGDVAMIETIWNRVGHIATR